MGRSYCTGCCGYFLRVGILHCVGGRSLAYCKKSDCCIFVLHGVVGCVSTIYLLS